MSALSDVLQMLRLIIGFLSSPHSLGYLRQIDRNRGGEA